MQSPGVSAQCSVRSGRWSRSGESWTLHCTKQQRRAARTRLSTFCMETQCPTRRTLAGHRRSFAVDGGCGRPATTARTAGGVRCTFQRMAATPTPLSCSWHGRRRWMRRMAAGASPLRLSVDGRLLSAVLGGRRAAGEGCRRWTALHCAACKGRTNAIAALLAAGADESAKNNGGHVPLDIVPQTTAAGAQFGPRWQWRRAGTPQRRRQRATGRLWHTRTLLPWCTPAGGASSIALRSRWRTHGVATWPEPEHLLRPYR